MLYMLQHNFNDGYKTVIPTNVRFEKNPSSIHRHIHLFLPMTHVALRRASDELKRNTTASGVKLVTTTTTKQINCN